MGWAATAVEEPTSASAPLGPRGLQQLQPRRVSSFQSFSSLGEIPLRGEGERRWGVRKEGRKEGR